MIGKNKIKLYSQLKQKKYQKLHGLFVAEGKKTISELLKEDFYTESILHIPSYEPDFIVNNGKLICVEEETIKKISTFKTPQPIIGIFGMPKWEFDINEIESDITLVFDRINDPGNLGTIVRIADWYNIRNIICSPDSVDIFNPKAIQASMGSMARVKVLYKNLNEILKNRNIPVYGTCLDGDNLYGQKLEQKCFIVFGNESTGIGDEVEKMLTKKILIPGYPVNRKATDSLNISISAGIICSEFRREAIQSERTT